MERKDIESSFIELLSKERNYQIVLELVKKYSSGSIWLIGGTVFRNLAHILYNTPKSTADFDFIVGKLLYPPKISNWRITKNSYGNLKFIKDNLSVDCIPTENVNYFNKTKLSPSIDLFLSGTPLNIQSIVYDVTNSCIIGNIGLAALYDKIVAVNNLEEAEHDSQLHNRTVNDLILNKALSLGFTPQLVDK